MGQQIDELRYFLAICEENLGNYKVYPLFFINNSLEEIEVIILVRTIVFDRIDTIEKIEDIEKDGVGFRKYLGIPAKSCFKIYEYYDWEFDWSDGIYAWIKTRSKEERLHFYMEKYFILNTKVNFIPTLNKGGWICLSWHR